MTPEQIGRSLQNLSVSKLAGGRQAPHKPLLLLLALRRLVDGEPRLAPVAEIARELKPILDLALPEVAQPSPWEPIWRLESEVWELAGPDGDPRAHPRDSDDPPLAEMRQPGLMCGLTHEVHSLLRTSPDLLRDLRDQLVRQYLGDTPEEAIRMVVEDSTSSGRVWWVNQGQTYEQERDGGYVWAPTVTKAGHPVAHHTAVSHLRPGDVVIHYSRGAIRALGRVTASPRIMPRPTELPEGSWEREGHRAEVRYFELGRPVPLEELADRPRGDGPFSNTGAVNQGYLYQLPPAWAARLRSQFSERWPAGSPWAPRSHWLFQANPEKWNLAERLETWRVGEVEPWSLTRYREDVLEGDDVLLFSSGTDGGILAIGVIEGKPVQRQRPEWQSEGPGEQLSIGVRLARRIVPPIDRERLKAHPVLGGLSVFKMANATNYKVTDEEWSAVSDMVDAKPAAKSRCVVVYVGQSAERNFTFSRPKGRWGWTSNQPEYALIGPGDLILFALGYTGGSPRVQLDEFIRHQFRRVVVGRVTTRVTQEGKGGVVRPGRPGRGQVGVDCGSRLGCGAEPARGI